MQFRLIWPRSGADGGWAIITYRTDDYWEWVGGEDLGRTDLVCTHDSKDILDHIYGALENGATIENVEV